MSDRESDAKAATVCKELNILKAIFGYAVRTEYLPSNPAREVKGPKVVVTEQPYLTIGQCKTLVASCPAWLKPMVQFGFLTGLRLGNVIKLEWQHVDAAQGWLHIPTTKNGEPLHVPLTALALAMLLSMMKAAGRPARRQRVFGYTGEHNKASVAFKRAAVKAKLPAALHFHNLRHSFCANGMEAGTDAITMQALMGHKTASMTRRYTHLSPGYLKGAAAKLDIAFAGFLPEPDGTQMRTSETETVSIAVHPCPSDENIQASDNTAVRELNA